MSQRFYSASSGREKSSKSIGSRTSISIKLPEQHVDQRLAADSPVQIRALSPTRTSRHEYTDGFQQYSRNTSASARNISVHSNGTIPPQATPTKTLLTDNEYIQLKLITTSICLFVCVCVCVCVCYSSSSNGLVQQFQQQQQQ